MEIKKNVDTGFFVCVPAGCAAWNEVVCKCSIILRKSGLLLGCLLNSFLPPSHRSLPSSCTLTLTFTLAFTFTVFRPLTFWSSSIFIWHINLKVQQPSS